MKPYIYDLNMKKTALIFIITIMVVSCSAEFAHNQFNLIFPWYIKRYIHLEEGQSRFLKRRIEYHHQWHRKNQLPEYIDHIDTVLALLHQLEDHTPIHKRPKVSEVFLKLNVIQYELHTLSQALTVQIAPDLTKLFLTASNFQLMEIYERFDKQNQQNTEALENLTLGDLKRHQRDTLQSQLKRWIGRLTTDQKHFLDDWELQYIPTAHETGIYRTRWHLRFRDLMSLYKGKQLDISHDLIQLFATPDAGWHPELIENKRKNRDITTRLFANITLSLTEKQRYRVIRKLTHLKKTVAKLAAK